MAHILFCSRMNVQLEIYHMYCYSVQVHIYHKPGAVRLPYNTTMLHTANKLCSLQKYSSSLLL